jgi:hypothetical protein
MLAAGGVALAGLVVAQTWQSGQRAQASALAALPISGRVVNDLYAGGLDLKVKDAPTVTDPDAPGVPGVQVELWRESGNNDGQAYLESTATTNQDGRYQLLALDWPASYLLRVRPAKIDGVNAMQSYLGTEATGANAAYGFCWDPDRGDYALSRGGYCYGARRDGVDPPEVSAPLGPLAQDEDSGDWVQTGQANTVARVVAESDDPVTVDFGLTAAASWGDLPDEYQTTKAAGGPYALGTLRLYYNPGPRVALVLGSASTLSRDGKPTDDAVSDEFADDGLEFALKEWRYKANSEETITVPDNELTWYSAQDAVFTNDTEYRVRAKITANCDFLPKATVKLWASPIDNLTGGPSGHLSAQPIWQLSPRFHCTASEVASGGQATREVYGDLDFGRLDGWDAEEPDGGFTNLYLRARVGIDPGFTAYSPGEPNDPYTEPWIMPGEIEDYRAHLAYGVVYFRTHLPEGVDAAFAYEYTGFRDDLDFDLPFEGGVVSAEAMYGLVDPAVTVVAAGAPGADSTNGWQLSGTRENPWGGYCLGGEQGQGGGGGIEDGVLVFSDSSHYSEMVLCDLNYGATLDPAISSMTVWPTPDPDKPVGYFGSGDLGYDGRYVATVSGSGTVTDINGATIEAPAVGELVTVVAEPVGGATSEGMDCTRTDWSACAGRLDANGQAEFTLRSQRAGTYRVTAHSGAADGPVIGSQEVYFAWGDPQAVKGGEVTIDKTTVKHADYGLLPGAPGYDGTWDYYTANIYVWDDEHKPVSGLESSPGWTYGSPNLLAGNCGTATAASAVDGQPGHYQIKLYSSYAWTTTGCVFYAKGVQLWDKDTDDRMFSLTWLPLEVADPSKSFFASRMRMGSVAGPDSYAGAIVVLKDANGSMIPGSTSSQHPLWAWSPDNSPDLQFEVDYCVNEELGAEFDYGSCLLTLSSNVVGTYRPEIILNPGTSDEATIAIDRPVFFGYRLPTAEKSSAVASRSPGQAANSDYGYQTITVRLRDFEGSPLHVPSQNDTVTFTVAPATADEYGGQGDPYEGEGLEVGQFQCVYNRYPDRSIEELYQDECFTGTYTAVVRSDFAGDRRVVVTASSYYKRFEIELVNGDDRDTSVLTLPFVTPLEASVDDSVLEVTPADQDGASVAVGVGERYTATATVLDEGGKNPLRDQYVQLLLEPGSQDGEECPATFSNGGLEQTVKTSLLGKAQATVVSAEPTTCVLVARLGISWRGDELPGSPQELTWAEPVTPPSTYTVWFDSRGGSRVDDIVIGQGEAVTELPLPVWAGRAFVGWFNQDDGGTRAEAPFTPVADVTLFALWRMTPAFGDGLTRLLPPQAPGIAGRTSVAITAVVVDLDGSPIEAELVDFFVPAGLSAGMAAGPMVLQVPTDRDGRAELAVTSGTAGTYGVTARVGGEQITEGSPAAARFVVAPDLAVHFTAVARCAAGKNQLAVTAFNDGQAPLDFEVASEWGSKSFTNIQPGKNAFHAFTVRSKDVAAGQVDVTVSTIGADRVTVTRAVPFDENHCG